jgi:hypothetical protein
MSRTYGTKPARSLKRTGNHVRIDLGGDDALTELGCVYIARPIYPIIVTPDLEILDGNRRHAGVMSVNPDAEVPICITGEPWSDAAKLEIQIESAIHTRGLSDFEQYAGCSQWLALNPDATAKELAARIHRDEAVVSKLLSLGRCVDAVKDAAKAGRIGYTVWHQLSKLSPAEQIAALADGATRDQLQQRRRNGNSRAATVKASSIPLILTNGLAVTFKAEGLTLAMALDALADIKQELKEAIDFDHDARTFAVLMKKRARELAKRR